MTKGFTHKKSGPAITFSREPQVLSTSAAEDRLGFDQYDHTDTDYPVWIHIKPIPIILFGFISNRYRYQYICLAP